MLPGGISRSYSAEQLQIIPSVCQFSNTSCLSRHISVEQNSSCVSHRLVVCVIVSLGRASLSCRSIRVSVFRLAVAHRCLGVGGCFGAASTAVIKPVKNMFSYNNWHVKSTTSFISCHPIRASGCTTCQSLPW